MGFPSPGPAIDDRSTSHSPATYYFRCNTDAMLEAFIPKGAIVAVDLSETPVNGKIVVAKIQGEIVIRKLQKNDYKTKLLATDKRFPDIVMDDSMEVIGVVKSVIIQFK